MNEPRYVGNKLRSSISSSWSLELSERKRRLKKLCSRSPRGGDCTGLSTRPSFDCNKPFNVKS